MKVRNFKRLLSPFCKIRHRLFHAKGNIYVGHNTTIRKPKNCYFAKDVNVSPFCLLIAGGGFSFRRKGLYWLLLRNNVLPQSCNRQKYYMWSLYVYN